MEENGFRAQVRDIPDWEALKARYHVPPELQACHTAIVDGYVIEGHVPPEDVQRLLAERPDDVVGLAVPGMPVGSPGMEAPGWPTDPFAVVAFDENGPREIYAEYR